MDFLWGKRFIQNRVNPYVSPPKTAVFLHCSKFVIFKFQAITDINAKGEQRQRYLRYDTGIIIADIGVIATNISHCAEHKILLKKSAPGIPGADDD